MGDVEWRERERERGGRKNESEEKREKESKAKNWGNEIKQTVCPNAG